MKLSRNQITGAVIVLMVIFVVTLIRLALA